MNGSAPRAALVFGASGQIGRACADALALAGDAVVRSARHAGADGSIIAFDPFDADKGGLENLPGGAFDAIVWAQGANLNDSLTDYDRQANLALYRANALFIADTMAALLAAGRIRDGARLCVIGSVWQTVARRSKLSYMMTKAAVQGLVMSAAIDLADRGILVNAVLPGALDTPMTRAALSPAQIAQVAGSTPFGRLAAIGDVAALVAFLCSPANTSITGQFVAVDLGFQHARLV